MNSNDTIVRSIPKIDDYFKNRHPEVYSGSHEENICVWKNTQHLFLQGRFKDIKPPLPQGYSVQWRLDMSTRAKPYTNTIVNVYNCDTLDGAKRMINHGLKPLVLNMASDIRPGGGVRKGSKAQEECLFRRSNYFLSLDMDNLPPKTYPLQHSTAIYSPQVYVIKAIDNTVLPDADQFYADFIAITGLRRPKLNNMKTTFRFDEDRELLRERVERIYQVALDNNHDSMLLGALGCGAFMNPVEEVVEIFKYMNQKYDGYFKQIDFAVLAEEGNPNYDVFNRVLTTNNTQ